MNGFFKKSDPHIPELNGYQLPDDWWSRPWEYAWAIEFAKPEMTVADMGCGWMYRPFKDALAKSCRFVYAVDADKRLFSQYKAENMMFVEADISNEIFAISEGLLDLVFCISVLEDLKNMVGASLKEFRRCIGDDGRIVLTFDVPYREAPTPIYPGLPLDKFERAMQDVGLAYDGEVDYSKDGAVFHNYWNLCCFHCVLRKA